MKESFSKELVDFSKILDTSLEKIARDMRSLREAYEVSDKEITKIKKSIKDDLKGVKEEVIGLKSSISSINRRYIDLEKKLKKAVRVSEGQATPKKTSLDELKSLKEDINEVRINIKNIEGKLKII